MLTESVNPLLVHSWEPVDIHQRKNQLEMEDGKCFSLLIRMGYFIYIPTTCVSFLKNLCSWGQLLFLLFPLCSCLKKYLSFKKSFQEEIKHFLLLTHDKIKNVFFSKIIFSYLCISIYIICFALIFK